MPPRDMSGIRLLAAIRLREWAAKIDELKVKADKSTADAKIEYC